MSAQAAGQPQPIRHDFAFDPTYGYDQERLLAVGAPDEPADFAAFWQATADEASRVPLRLEARPQPSKNDAVELLEVRFDSFGGHRVGAWLLRPRRKAPAYALVGGHGYGGRAEAPVGPDEPDHIALYPCAPGFHLSARADLPDVAARHVVHGIAHRDTYLIRACVASLWAAASALLELHPEFRGRLHYDGGSFGGGLGALALPWEPRFARAKLVVPTFGHHPLRLQCPCVGSGEAVREHHRSHPGIARDVLPYYDAAIAARRVRQPVLVAPALFDPAVPPPGQFAVANALPSAERFILRAGHHPYRGQREEDEALGLKSAAWFAGMGDASATPLR